MKINKSKRPNHQLDVLGIGAPLVDQILHVTDEFLATIPGKKGGMEAVNFPTFTKLLRESNTSPKLIPGGSCANVLRGLSQLGHACAFQGKIGTDAVGELFLKDLDALGIKSLCIPSDTPTGQVLSFVTPDGERTFQSYLGAGQEMCVEDLNPTIFEKARLVHIEGYILIYPGLAQCIVQYAKRAGTIVSLDLASFELISTLRSDFLDLIKNGVDICFGNEKEIKALTDLPAYEGCVQLKNICPITVATMGKKGCWIGHDEEVTYSPSIPIEHPLDTTGAGDLFISGFLHGYMKEKSLEKCAYFGALAGATVIQVEGAHLTNAQWQVLSQKM